MESTKELSTEEKLQLVLLVIKEPKKMDWYLGQAGVSRSAFYKWRSRFFEGGREGLKTYKTGSKGNIGKEHTPKEKELAKQLETAKQRIGHLSTELEVLKKNKN